LTMLILSTILERYTINREKQTRLCFTITDRWVLKEKLKVLRLGTVLMLFFILVSYLINNANTIKPWSTTKKLYGFTKGRGNNRLKWLKLITILEMLTMMKVRRVKH
jgi:hypothetical protein